MNAVGEPACSSEPPPTSARSGPIAGTSAGDPGRTIGRRPLLGPRFRPEAAGGPPHQAPWTVHSPSSTLAGPIEFPMRDSLSGGLT
jgi:hypothetical protein